MEPFLGTSVLEQQIFEIFDLFQTQLFPLKPTSLNKIFDISHRSNWPISVKTELRLFMTFPTYALFEKCFHIS